MLTKTHAVDAAIPAAGDRAQKGAGREASTPTGALKANSIGLVGVVFMVVAFSAPITAMTGNVPVAVGWGNGIGAPAGFIVATIVLTIFSVGFTALARHITAAGAFYTFVSRGLAKPPGLAAGMLSMTAYMAMEAALIGIFSYYCVNAFNPLIGVEVPWAVYGLIAITIISLLSYRDVALASKVLAVVLIAELFLLFAMSFGVLFKGGGVDGLMFESLNPVNAFSTNGLAAGSVGVGLLFAFWSWVGFESTAIYGEESTDPRKVVPRATMIAVIGIGVTYTFISWMMVAGNGAEQAVALAQSDDPMELAYMPMRTFVGAWGVLGMKWIVLGGSFACALAIHNSAARYLFAFGRDGILFKRLGLAHSVHQSPAFASVFQSLFAAAIVGACYFAGIDPYGELFVLVAIMATVNLMLAQAATSASVVSFFHFKKQHPETAHWWRTLLAPIIGGVGMLYVVFTMLSNMATAAGAASETLFGKALPWIVLAIAVASMAAALVWRKSRPDIYRRIGSSVFMDEQIEAVQVSVSSTVTGGQGVFAIMDTDPKAVSAVLHWAADFSQADDAMLTLTHASKAARHYITSKWAQSFVRAVAPKVQLEEHTLNEADAEDMIRPGSAATTAATMLVISSSGISSISRDLGVNLMRRPPCPVVVVNREGVTLPGPDAPLVVWVDPQGQSGSAVGFASTMAQRFQVPMVLLAVYGQEAHAISAYTSQIKGQVTEKDAAAMLEDTHRQTRELFPHIDVRTELVTGDPYKVLAERSQSAGALVVAARDLDALTALFGGTPITSLPDNTTCPVIYVPVREGASEDLPESSKVGDSAGATDDFSTNREQEHGL
jgi:amino acid transporter